MSITLKDVEHIAHLARIELTSEEKVKFKKELGNILTFIEKLSEINTSGVEPMIGGTVERNVQRADEKIEDGLQGKPANLIDQAPERKQEWVKVKKIF